MSLGTIQCPKASITFRAHMYHVVPLFYISKPVRNVATFDITIPPAFVYTDIRQRHHLNIFPPIL